MMMLGAFLEVVGIGLIPVFVSIITSPEIILEYDLLVPIWEAFGVETAGDLLIYGACFLIVVFILKNTYIIFYKYVQSKFIWGRFALLGSNLFQKYMSAPYDFHLERNTAELLRNVTQEAQHLAKFVMTPFLKIAMDFVLIIGIFSLLLWTEPLITLGVFILLGGGGGLFLRIIRGKTRDYGKTAQEDRGNMIKSVNEGLGGFKDARILNRAEWFSQRFNFFIKSYSISQAYAEVVKQMSKPVIETIAITGMLLIAIALYLQGRGLETVIPMLALFGAATMRLMPAIREFTQAFTDLRYYSYTVDPIYNDTELLDRVEKIELNNRNNSNTGKKFNFKGSITFNNVSYIYPGAEKNAIDNLSLQINKGQAFGFVGASGAGKTTLIDLLLGLLKPQSGTIEVDGNNILDDISGWQKNIGYIPQFIFLADDSIKNNVAFGLSKNQICEEKLQSALEAAQLSKYVNNLPNGVNTIIGEDGTRLSGGQRQRIGIARALYHDPQLIIMDEATSALDNVTERFVIDAIEQFKGDRTIVMIAHRISTVKNCDKLILMKNGRISDSGTYIDLINNNSDFSKLANN